MLGELLRGASVEVRSIMAAAFVAVVVVIVSTAPTFDSAVAVDAVAVVDGKYRHSYSTGLQYSSFSASHKS